MPQPLPRGRPSVSERTSLAPLAKSDLPLPLLHRGKVRDVYEVDDRHLLMVASDRVSAFDVVMDEPIPRKGEVLTQLSAWWLERLTAARPHHLISVHPKRIVQEVPSLADVAPEQWARRSMLVQRTEPVLVECVVRGYLSGSAWREYREHGTLAGERLPWGLVESQRISPPIFSPATKAQEGHDENIPVTEVVRLLGPKTAEVLERRSHALYTEAASIAAERGILLADTKFEFGRIPSGELLLIDEILTPDSSRYWPQAHYREGQGQPSMDKQPVRDFLDSLHDWNKQAPPPPLPPPVVSATTERYLRVFRTLTGESLDDFTPPLETRR